MERTRQKNLRNTSKNTQVTLDYNYDKSLFQISYVCRKIDDKKTSIFFIINNFPMWFVLSKKQKAKYKPIVEVLEDGSTKLEYKLANANKVNKPKYCKFNMQQLYSGNLHYSVRAKIVKELHDLLMPTLRQAAKEFPKFNSGRFHIEYTMNQIPNAASVRLNNETYTYNTQENKSRWDLFNTITPWIKVFEDCLVESNILPDDSVKFLVQTTYNYNSINRLDKRFLSVTLTHIS